MGAPNPDVTALVNQLALQHWTVANTPDLSGVVAAVNQQLGPLGGEINAPLVAFANAQLDALFATQEATEPAHGGSQSFSIGAEGVPSANGLVLIGSVLSATLADATHPGDVSTGTQTFGGTKTISTLAVTTQLNMSQPAPVNFANAQTIADSGAAGLTITIPNSAVNAHLDFVLSGTGDKVRFFLNSTQEFAITDLGVRFGGNVLIGAGNSTGTPGNATLNFPAGRSAIAAGATTVTITSSFVSASSIILVCLQTNDATAILKNVVPGAGSFVVNLTAAATANTNFCWFVMN
jgi:hypothetical protein